MMNATPTQRIHETLSPRKIIAANVANTKLSAVNGQRKLMSLLFIRSSRQPKNAEQNLRAGGAGFEHTKNFGNGVAVHVADVDHAFFQKDDAGGFTGKAEQQNREHF